MKMSVKKDTTLRKHPNTPSLKHPNTPSLKQPLHKTLTRSLTNLSVESIGASSSTPDWNLQCSLAYNEYLEAIMDRHLVEKAINEYEHLLDDQLAMEAKVLEKLLVERDLLENEINTLEIQITTSKLTLQLNEKFAEITNCLQENQAMENFQIYVEFLENVTSRVYLLNVKQFSTQTEYDDFRLLVKKCTASMKNLKEILDKELVSKTLTDKLQTFLKLNQEIKEHQKMISDILSHINLLVFKNISNKFADLNDAENLSN